MLVELCLTLTLFIIALWQKDHGDAVFLFVAAAIIAVFTGIDWLKTNPIIGLFAIGLAGFEMYEAVMHAFFWRKKGK